jgi:putative membrane protein
VHTLLPLAEHWDGGPGPWVLVFPLFWLTVLAFFWFAFARGRSGRWGHRSSAREILAERFARGEIGAEEYRSRLQELR